MHSVSPRQAARRVFWLTALAFAPAAIAGPENVRFPAEYASWQRYAVVDRHDTKQYRELYARPAIVQAVREGRPIPDGAVIVMAIHAAATDAAGKPARDAGGRFIKGDLTAITVMEKRKGWGTAYPDEWRNGDWEYASFTADGKPNEKANGNIRNCFACHKPHEKQDYVISLASLAGTLPKGPAAMKSGALDVSIANFAFGPAKMSTVAGKPVTWTNTDDSPHQISVQGKQKTAVLLKGQSASLTFDQPGLFDYMCSLHPGMKGQVEVK
jgi:plastocyanin